MPVETLSTPDSPSNQSIKRKRSFTESTQDRKIQKLSSSLANDIARSLSVSMDDVDMPTAPAAASFTVYNKPRSENPMPALRRISLSGTLNPIASSIDQWLDSQAQQHHIPLADFKRLFHEKQKALRQEIDLLQTPDQPFDMLRDHLSKVLRLANELGGDHTLPFTVILLLIFCSQSFY